MAREPIEILKMQLGNLLAELALLTSQNEKLEEELKAARASAAEKAQEDK